MAEITALSTDDFQVTTTDSEEVARESLEEPEKPADDVEQKAVDGRERDEKGKFAVKPIPPEKLKAKEPEKPKEGAKPVEAKTEDKPDTPEQKEEKKEKSKAQLRVEQATRQAAEYRRELEALRKEVAAKETPADSRPRPKFQAPDDDPEPVLGEGVDPVEWVKGRTDWAARQAVRDAERRQSEQQRTRHYHEQIDKHVSGYVETCNKYAEKDPDFLERVIPELRELKPSFMLGPNERPTVWNGIADEISGSARAPELMLHLSEHPDVIQRLATLSPRELFRAMAQIEARLDPIPVGTPESTPPYIPKARGPVTPATGGPTATDTDLDPETTDADTWVRVMNERDRKAGRL